MGSGEDHTDKYDHEHALEECAEFSGRHQQFIRDNLQQVKQQCKDFKICLNELYSQENIHLILQGGDIDLRLICGFLYPSSSNATTISPTECQGKERRAIKEDVSNKLKDALELEGDHHDGEDDWNEVKDCLHNKTESDSRPDQHLDQICGLAAQQDTDICSTRVHHHIESFLNHQLEHIQCTCNSLKKISPRFPFRYRVAIGAGGLLFLILLLVFIVCLCKRRRKKNRKKRKLREESLQRVDYHISRENSRNRLEYNDDPYNVYQEPIYKKNKGITTPVKPPELPPRYTKYPREGTKDHSLDYLLPADLPSNSPIPDKSLLTSDRRGADGASIEDISGKIEMPKPEGYDPLGPRDDDDNPVYRAVSTSEDPEHKNPYFVLEEGNEKYDDGGNRATSSKFEV